MNNIKKLPQNVVNKIAAGEVVERPASVLKELLENSLDAGATSINVEIEEGGKKLIAVQDNGQGMGSEDILLAVQPHTTSKISDIEDLESLNTFGFRGEALASIASVSKFTIKSKTSDAPGHELTIEGGEILRDRQTVIPQGTIVEIKDLFYNVPARKKFMKSDQTEIRNILDVFINMAMVNPQVAFKLSHNGRQLYHLPAENASNNQFIAENRARKFLDIPESENLLNAFFDGNGIQVSGFVGHPKVAVNKVRDQYIFVNKRPVNDKIVGKAVREGFGTFISKEKLPVFVISIQIRGDFVDVNVHPRKTEVKFKDSHLVFSAVRNAVKEALQKDLDFNEQTEAFIGEIDTYEEKNDMAVMRLRDSDSVFRNSRSEVTKSWENSKPAQREKVQDSLAFTKALLQTSQDSELAFSPSHEEELVPSKAIQMHNRYLVVEAPGEIQIWDQHAAAERIRYEKLLAEYKNKGIETQNLLTPETVSLSAKQISVVEEFSEDLMRLGFSVEVFGKDEVNVRSVPSRLANADIQGLFKDLLVEISENADLENKTNDIEKNYDYYIKTLSCHSSVTANMKLQPEAVAGFIKDLKQCENPYSCPHGRPIIWRIKTSEIDRKFER